MKLKYVAAALGLMASASSFAAILSTNTAGGSELFLAVWEEGVAGKPDQSFTLDLGITTGTFLASQSSSQLWATLVGSDAVWSNFVATSDASALKYAVLGGNSFVPATVFSTVTAGSESSIAGTYTNTKVTTSLGVINAYAANVSDTGTHLTQANGESVNAKGSGAYYQDGFMETFNGVLFQNSNAVGVSSEFTTLRRGPGGNANPTFESVMPGVVSFGKVGNDYVLSYNVAAVPEPSGYAMVLAGLGVMGLVISRRKNS
jgi:hypothetical protein